jgi:hypothetical protein
MRNLLMPRRDQIAAGACHKVTWDRAFHIHGRRELPYRTRSITAGTLALWYGPHLGPRKLHLHPPFPQVNQPCPSQPAATRRHQPSADAPLQSAIA